jgi:Fe-S-cluster containining protein
MDVHFACTQCGACCRDLKLPLAVAEAIRWLQAGHPVQVICEAAPSPAPAAPPDPRGAHFRRRAFAALSGTLPVDVAVILAANLEGRCPNLRDDQRCAIYESRPVVCRVYPAEINPFIELNPAAKVCPPEAWAGGSPLLQRGGRILDAVLNDDIDRARAVNHSDADVKMRICASLQLAQAARAGEGFVIYSPQPQELLAALLQATTDQPPAAAGQGWGFLSDRQESLQALAGSGAVARRPPGVGTVPCEFVGFGVAPPSAPK